jgi:dipeptidyl aminopeptidase/acylaminoacyl peptidase
MQCILRAILLAVLPVAVFAGKWSIDDVLLAERADEMELSRDATQVVWVKIRMDEKKGRSVSNLILRNLRKDYEVQLTRGKDNNTAPKFSPDGLRIAFLSNRETPEDADEADEPDEEEDDEDEEDKSKPAIQIWLIDTRGGEPYVLTDFENSVKRVDWLDNETLLAAAAEDPSHYHQQAKKRKDTSKVIDDDAHELPVRLFRIDVKTKQATRLTSNTDRIVRVAVSPDGAWAVTVHERSLRYVYDQKIRPVTFLHNLRTGASEQLFPDGKLLPSEIAFGLDSKGFYFSAPYTTHPDYIWAAVMQLYYCDLATRSLTQVPLDWDKELAEAYAVTPSGFAALLANGVRHRAALYERSGSGWTHRWIEGAHASNLFDLKVSHDGKSVLYSYSTASTPEQWYSAKLEGAVLKSPKLVTALNRDFGKKTIARTETVHWKGARDELVEGILHYPHGYQPGRRYPLVLMIHGGPHGVDLDAFEEDWSAPINLLAQRGAFIFRPNYHGSSNYGLQWAESISGGYYNELEWIDAERGVDFLIEKGLVDADKLGVMGWSNGSIITIEITTRTVRYKAASAGAGDVNWISDWGNCRFGHSFDHYYLGKTPLEDPEFYMRKSALFRLDKVRTPTIIFFGTEDTSVPTEQGWQHYRALQQLGNTDVRFVLFPGEEHSPRKLAHQRRKLEEELAWFDKHLFQSAGDGNESLKPASPLAAAWKSKHAGKVPETVLRGDIEVGRFEVTRAQYAAFAPDYRFPAGTENHPASGISFEDARRYCEWLSETTGRRYRLGTEEEMAELLKRSGKENTLDFWAGYSVNADDARRLASSIEELGPGALLKPVGSSEGDGDDPIFDLGGNVAEWVVTAGGGKALGGSADRPADAKSATPPRAEYMGFRVVAEPE